MDDFYDVPDRPTMSEMAEPFCQPDVAQQACDRGDCTHEPCKLRAAVDVLRKTCDLIDKCEGRDSSYHALCVATQGIRYHASVIECAADAYGSHDEALEISYRRGINKRLDEKA